MFSMPTTVRQQDRGAYPVPPPTRAWGVPNAVSATGGWSRCGPARTEGRHPTLLGTSCTDGQRISPQRLGTGEVESVHLLLALLWDPEKWLFAEHQGVPRERVVEALSRHGVALPPAPLPPLPQVELTQRVDLPYDELDAVISLLLQRHRPPTAPGFGFGFGFNQNDAGNTWVAAGEGIDLHAIVTEARRASEP